MSSTRFAVVGLGRIGARHAQTINALDGVELAAVCDPDPSMLARAAEFAPAAKPFQDFKAMLDSRSVDMVVLAVPSQMHCAMTLDALNAGCHVLVEKPVAHNSDEAAQMAQTAQRLGLHLTVHQSMRYWGDTMLVHKLIASGKLGRIFQVYRGQHFGGPPREDWQIWRKNNGGAIANFGTHLVDAVLHVSNAVPRSVTASAAQIRDQGDVEDHFKIVIACEDDVTLECEALRTPLGKALWHICGTEGCAFAAETLPVVNLQIQRFDGESWTETYDFATEPAGIAMRMYYEQLCDALASGAAPPVSIESVCQQMQVLDAARTSLAEAQRSVATPQPSPAS